MLDLDLVAVFSVTPAGSGVGFLKKKKKGEERTTSTPKAKAVSLKWKLLAPKGERDPGWGWDCKEWEGKRGEWEMKEARQTITNSHN